MRGLTALRLAAVLMPAALALHEGVYLLAGGAERGSHGYLAELVPLLVAAAASLAVAALLLPALGIGGGDDRLRSRPFAIALALVGVFGIQEGVEVVLLGGGAAQLAATITAAWALVPLALLLGVLGASAVEALDRGGRLIATLLERPRPDRPTSSDVPSTTSRSTLAVRSPLAFGLARRPPPLAS